jgi:hypothetical protein
MKGIRSVTGINPHPSAGTRKNAIEKKEITRKWPYNQRKNLSLFLVVARKLGDFLFTFAYCTGYCISAAAALP